MRFETDPGPCDDPSFDFSLWADRRLEMPGYTAPSAVHPAPPPLDLRRLASRQDGSVVPPSGFTGKTSVDFPSPQEVVLRYEGADGKLEYHWQPCAGDVLLGSVALRATMTGDIPVEVALAGQSHLEWTADARLMETKLTVPPLGGLDRPQAALTRTYLVGGQPATVTVSASLQEKSLVFDVTCDQPFVRALESGAWGPVMRRQTIDLPYYSSPVSFLGKENLFAGHFLDWTFSNASSQAGGRAVYDPRTDATRNPLRERLVYTAAWHLDETLPNIPNAPSPFRAELSRRVVLDIWGATFASIREKLHSLIEGSWCGPAVAIIHDWQFGGYDNMLPQHVPANASLGGDPAMADLARTGERDGILMALHENYVDYYPNAPGYAATDIALAADGSRIKAWLHPGTKIQSFAVKPTRMLPLAMTQGAEVLRRYGTEACYLDVHSAVPPWFHVDADVSQPGAGTFGAVWDAHRTLWAYERALHKGPVFGEGKDHWYWSGLLDGVEAQFGEGWPDGQGTSAPLLVDFDLLKIHPLQLNHGMGYYERWWAHGPNGDEGLADLLDRYRMQEAAYGHEGFLGGAAWRDPGAVWLESHLLPPLTERTALAGIAGIDYEADGTWMDATAAVKAHHDFSRLRVRYDNGLTVWANGSRRPWEVSGVIIPPDGWLARGAGLIAGTTSRQGVVSDLAETADSVFVNARPIVDPEVPGAARVAPSVVEFTPVRIRTFRASYRWSVGQALKQDYRCFVHFVPANPGSGPEAISFQQDHELAVPSSQWRSDDKQIDGPWFVTVPDAIPPGNYSWTIGLFGADGARVTLQGPTDNHQRVILGTLHVAPDGTTSFAARPSSSAPGSANVPVLDFGPIRTDGSVAVQRVNAEWVLRRFPPGREFTVNLRADRFGHPASVPVENGWWRLPASSDPVYRWPASR